MLRATVQGATGMDRRLHRRQLGHGTLEASEMDGPGSPLPKSPAKEDAPTRTEMGRDASDDSPPPGPQSGFSRARAALWAFLDDPTSSTPAQAFSLFILVLIALSTVVFVIETVPSIVELPGARTSLRVMETVCIAAFTVELLLRILSNPSARQFWTDPFTWIDLLAIVPFYVELIVPNQTNAGSLGVVRAIRLVRVVRVVKVSRYSQSIKVFAAAMVSSLRPLTMLFFLVGIAVVLFSSALYYSELTPDGCREDGWVDLSGATAIFGQFTCFSDSKGWTQLALNGTFRYTPPESVISAVAFARNRTEESLRGSRTVFCTCTDPNPFHDIPATFWWCVVTLTTVGYGDNVPVTGLGKFVAVITMFSGVIIIALPITVIGTNFSRVLREIQQERMVKELEAIDQNDDGLVDLEELRVMIERLTAAASDISPELIPSAEVLLDRYDNDKSGVLDRDEVERLKSDIRDFLGLAGAEKAATEAITRSKSHSSAQQLSSRGSMDGSHADKASAIPHSISTPAPHKASSRLAGGVDLSTPSAPPSFSATKAAVAPETAPRPAHAAASPSVDDSSEHRADSESDAAGKRDTAAGALSPGVRRRLGIPVTPSRPDHEIGDAESGEGRGDGSKVRWTPTGDSASKSSRPGAGAGAGADGRGWEFLRAKRDALKNQSLVGAVLRAEERLDRKLAVVATLLESLQQTLSPRGSALI